MLSPILAQLLTANLSSSLPVTGKIYSGKGLFNVALMPKTHGLTLLMILDKKQKLRKILKTNPPPQNHSRSCTVWHGSVGINCGGGPARRMFTAETPRPISSSCTHLLPPYLHRAAYQHTGPCSATSGHIPQPLRPLGTQQGGGRLRAAPTQSKAP